jgi:phenylacetate-coenzyme A ligase PaaK-like adenylate-forming protein
MFIQNRDEIFKKLTMITPSNFEEVALSVFLYQAKYNPLYARFVKLLKKKPSEVKSLKQIPFLPIQFFKSHAVKTGKWKTQTTFSSSGTTGQIPSKHLVNDLDFYLQNALKGFTNTYGEVENWSILALLPSYLERGGSSLVAMADAMIQQSKHAESGFFLHNHTALAERILRCQTNKSPTLLLGVSYALLDFAELFPMNLEGITVMETGGMKGRRAEMTREVLHETLKTAFQIPNIHSEYGMTEMFSQAYAQGTNVFTPMHSLKILTTEVNDPFTAQDFGRTGQINVIDLANLDTCAFIATEDLGKCYENGTFEVLGRMDTAEMRGCNLMIG